MPRTDLSNLLSYLDPAPLECDGLSRLAASDLIEAGERPQLMVGSLRHAGRTIKPHMWVEIEGLCVDYRARMWLGENEDVPHGVFHPADYPVQYEGEEMPAMVVSAGIKATMLLPIPPIHIHDATPPDPLTLVGIVRRRE